MATMSWEEALRHVGSLMPAGIEERILNAVPHYLWLERASTKREPRRVMDPREKGFCTHCRTWVPVEDTQGNRCRAESMTGAFIGDRVKAYDAALRDMDGEVRHKRFGICPNCGALVQYRELRYPRTKMRDQTLVIEYRKSLCEKDTVVCVGYDVDARWNNLNEHTLYAGQPDLPVEIIPCEVCVFRMGKGGSKFLYSYYASSSDNLRFFRAKDCTSGYKPDTRYKTMLDQTAFAEAVKETPLERMLALRGVQQFLSSHYYPDRIELMDRLAGYPTLEYLYKLGYDRVADSVICRYGGDLIRRKGAGAREVLRLTVDQWAEIRSRGMDVTPNMLKMLKFANHYHFRIPLTECENVYCKLCRYSYWDDSGGGYRNAITIFLKKYPQADAGRIFRYCCKKRVMLNDYIDYYDQLLALKMDVKDKTLICPRDFHEMHGRLSARIKAKANQLMKAKLQERVKKLTDYSFSAYGLVLRPMLTAEEVIREGTKLHHCVGGYVERYADGGTILCSVREETALETPLYTVEFTNEGRMVQCRGYKNQTLRAEAQDRLEQFWVLYKAMRADLLAQEKREARKARYAPAERKTA